MREMKDSGIEWVGEIPFKWSLNRIQYCLSEINVKNYPIQTDRILSLVKDKGVMLYEEKGDIGNKSKDNISEYKLAYPQTLVVNSMNILIGSVGISNYFGCVSPVYYVFKETDQSDLRYINYIFNTREFQRELHKYANGILEIRLRVSAQDIFKRLIPFPPKMEQNAIANYLDAKCSEIDSLTSDIQTQLDTLEQYKKSLITETVTKGLKNDVEMKDSGVQWIGTMPAHWKVIRLKNTAWLKGRIGWQGLRSDEFVDDPALPYLITGTDFQNGHIDWNTCAHISEERFEQDYAIHIKEDDLLITKDGTIGKVAVAIGCPEKVSLNSGVFIIRNTGKYQYYSRFMYYLFQSAEFKNWFTLSNAGNSTIMHLTQEKFYNFSFSFPPLDEQREIADYLDDKCTSIDTIIDDKKKQIDLIKDYKKSLIFEYVTGKKEVPAV